MPSEEKPALVPQLSWPEGEPNLGVGISRPHHKARTREFKLLVTFQTSKPMRMTILAESIGKAKLYASNRWPLAKNIEVIK